jgi:CubicO group peptidase (beta-lactamase class C family)
MGNAFALPLSLIFVLSLPSLVIASDAGQEKTVRSLMESAGIPGLQAAVIRDGHIIWANSYGDAVRPGNPGPRAPMRNDSILFSASVAKMFETVAVLQQLESGRLGLDDDINRVLPFSVRNPAWPDISITWRMLLTHTSSMKSEDDARLYGATTYGGQTMITLDQYIRNSFMVGGAYFWPERYLAGKPGTQRIYSNDAYDLAAAALQNLIHEDFDQYVSRKILLPLGMRDTHYSVKGPADQRHVVGYVSLKQKDGTYKFLPARDYWAHLPPSRKLRDHQVTCANYASGCAYTTALDLARFMLMLMNGGILDGERILKAESVAAMLTPTGFRNLDGWTQGLGVAGPKDLKGRQVWGHDGEDRGHASAFYFNPDTHVGAVVIVNGMDPEFTLNYAVVDIALHLMSWFE